MRSISSRLPDRATTSQQLNWRYAPSRSAGGNRYGWNAAAVLCAGVDDARGAGAEGAQEADITVAIATGRRAAYTTPLLEGHGVASGYAADYVQWSGGAHAGRRGDRPLHDGSRGWRAGCAGCCGRLELWSSPLTARDAASLCSKTWKWRRGAWLCGSRPTAMRLRWSSRWRMRSSTATIQFRAWRQAR